MTYRSVDVSASSASDYTPASGIVNFAAGESSRTFSVFITDDTVGEATETFELVLGNPSNATLDSPTTTTVSIIDNDKSARRKPARGGLVTTRSFKR